MKNIQKWVYSELIDLKGTEELIHRTTFRIRYADTDKMGIVYYGKYFELFEVGRTEWIRSFWKSYSDMEKEGIYLPVTKCFANYRQSFVYDDMVTILCFPISYSNSRIQFFYHLFNVSEQVPRVIGVTEHVFLGNNRKIIRMPQNLRDKLMGKIPNQIYPFSQILI